MKGMKTFKKQNIKFLLENYSLTDEFIKEWNIKGCPHEVEVEYKTTIRSFGGKIRYGKPTYHPYKSKQDEIVIKGNRINCRIIENF